MLPRRPRGFASRQGRASTRHDTSSGRGQRKTYQIQHKVDKIDEWARSLHRQYGGPIAIALELSKGPIVSALQKYDFFVLFPIDPTTLANHRKTFTLSGAKDDPTDAEYALDLLLKHTEHFQVLKPQSVEMIFPHNSRHVVKLLFQTASVFDVR